ELWKYVLPPAAVMGHFGSGTSPVMAGGMVVLVRDELNAPKIIALDAATGKSRGEKTRESKKADSTPGGGDTAGGKQVVTTGFARMIAYDLKTGEEKWSVAGMPSTPCSSPVVADGNVLFASWAPGDPDDKDFKMPAFDDLLKQAGEEKLGYLTKKGSEKTMLKGFFEPNDLTKDGKITLTESETLMELIG